MSDAKCSADLPAAVFLGLCRAYLGEVNTPYNKCAFVEALCYLTATAPALAVISRIIKLHV